jgi:hypothetical protein
MGFPFPFHEKQVFHQYPKGHKRQKISKEIFSYPISIFGGFEIE